MPDNLSDLLADEFTAHAVDLVRFESGLRRKVVSRLKKLEKELIVKLKKIDPTEPAAQSYRVLRQKKLLEQVQDTIKTAYRGYRTELKSELRDLASLESSATGNIINTVIGVDVSTVALPPNVLAGIVNNSLVEGDTIGSWVARQSASLRRRFEDQIRQGMLAGEPLGDLVRRIRGRAIPGRPGQFAGGIMQTSTREAEALARTATQQIAQDTRATLYRDNQDVLKGEQVLVTLDLRTSDICKSLSGGAWDFDGKPLPESTVRTKKPAGPPFHWQCRSQLLPITKSFKELGIRTKAKIPETTQASMDGQVAADLTYEQWLKKQSKDRQIEALGPTRYQLWKDGKIKSFQELTDQSARPLTVEELKAREGNRRKKTN